VKPCPIMPCAFAPYSTLYEVGTSQKLDFGCVHEETWLHRLRKVYVMEGVDNHKRPDTREQKRTVRVRPEGRDKWSRKHETWPHQLGRGSPRGRLRRGAGPDAASLPNREIIRAQRRAIRHRQWSATEKLRLSFPSTIDPCSVLHLLHRDGTIETRLQTFAYAILILTT